MGADSKIEWTHHTFNPWWGCTKVSEACRNCYAEAWDKRTGGAHWGPLAERRVFGPKHWAEPLKWNAAAALAGERHRVFCASMADVFDRDAPPGEREKLWPLIRATPSLDWLLLTKRPERIAECLPPDWGSGWRNVWLGASCEDRRDGVPRIAQLRAIPTVVRFLSCEPLLEDLGPLNLRGIHLVICGGESGPGARPMHPDWARSLRDQCAAQGVAFHFKQWGDHYPDLLAPSGFIRLGKKAAGRVLDGRTWDEMPASIAHLPSAVQP